MTKIRGAWLPLGLIAAAVLALGGLALARPASAAVSSLSIAPATQTVAPSATGVTVALEADATADDGTASGDAGDGIGAYDIDVTYDTTLLTVTGCTGGPGLCNDAVAGTVTFTGASASGLTGSPLELGTITFDAGATEDTAALTISVTTLSDPIGEPITVTPTDGEIVIAQPVATATPTATPTTAATGTPTPTATATQPAQLPVTGGSPTGSGAGLIWLSLIGAIVLAGGVTAVSYKLARSR